MFETESFVTATLHLRSVNSSAREIWATQVSEYNKNIYNTFNLMKKLNSQADRDTSNKQTLLNVN